MSQTIKKSQFLTAGYVLDAKTESGEPRVFAPGSVKVESTNTDVLRVVPDPEDQTKGRVEYVGPGDATLKATASILADHPTTAEGSLDVTVEDDSNAGTGDNGNGTGDNNPPPPPPAEVVKINLSLNL